MRVVYRTMIADKCGKQLSQNDALVGAGPVVPSEGIGIVQRVPPTGSRDAHSNMGDGPRIADGGGSNGHQASADQMPPEAGNCGTTDGEIKRSVVKRRPSWTQFSNPNPTLGGGSSCGGENDSLCAQQHKNGSCSKSGDEIVVATNPKSCDEDELMCCICLEGYNEENPILYGECKHHFHMPCLMAWKQRSNVCPMCDSETLRGVADDQEPPPRRTSPTSLDDHLSPTAHQRYSRREPRIPKIPGVRGHPGRSLQGRQPGSGARPTNHPLGGVSGDSGHRSVGSTGNGGRAATAKVNRQVSPAQNGQVASKPKRSFFSRVFCCFKR